MNENLHADDQAYFSKERDWSLSDFSIDSRTKLEQFYVNHKKFFKKRQEKLIIEEMREEHGEDAVLDNNKIEEVLKSMIEDGE